MVIQALLLQTARIIYTFYKHRKELHEYLGSSDERISPSHFLRMLALGCFDMIITLPIQLVALVTSALNQLPFQFYNGWSYLHSDWEPALFSKESWSMEKLTIFLVHWMSGFTLSLRWYSLLCSDLVQKQRKGIEGSFAP